MTLIATILLPAVAMAQEDESFDAHVTTSVDLTIKYQEENNKVTPVEKHITPMVQFALFRSKQEAQAAVSRLTAALNAMSTGDYEAWQKTVLKYKYRFNDSETDGSFTQHIDRPGRAILITIYMDNQSDEDIAAADPKENVMFQILEMTGNGKTEYKCPPFTIETVKFEAPPAIGKVSTGPVVKPRPGDDLGDAITIPISVFLPAGYVNEHSRLVIQPMAVECQTEDTIDYVDGLVYEGVEYHKMQDKAMLFNYMKNDRVAYTFVDEPLWKDEDFVCDTVLIYKKRDRTKKYKGVFELKVADANHSYYAVPATGTASCNTKDIFKFVTPGTASADMNVDEFEVVAQASIHNEERDLHLLFETGTSKLTKDSLNQENLDKLVDELRQYGETLDEITIEATASPEGGFERNMSLAQERSHVALAMVKNNLRGKSSIKWNVKKGRVCTWGEVADELHKNGELDLEDVVRTKGGASGYDGSRDITALPEYKEKIMPVLERLRHMQLQYKVVENRPMTKDEVLVEYVKRKKGLMDGTAPTLSQGDYYNLFTVLKNDTAEMDTLTKIAYKYMIKHKGYENVKFYMYVANKMAMLNLREKHPDTEVLKPFLNYNAKFIRERTMNTQAQKNRREVIINQLLTMLQANKADSAQTYSDYWFPNSTDPHIVGLNKYIFFKSNYTNFKKGALQGEDLAKFKNALNYVMKCAPDNEVVLCIEARKDLDKMANTSYKANLDRLEKMNNGNPLKWYLRGILEAEKEEEALKNSKSLKESTKIPDFLAYFHHSIELDKKYKWFYYNEGQVSDELRKVYPYDKMKFNAYREKFRSLTGIGDEQKTDELGMPMTTTTSNEPLFSGSEDDTFDDIQDEINNSDNSDNTENTEKQEN